MAKSIKVYSTPTCAFCTLVKDFLNSKKVSYEVIDLAEHPEKVEEMVDVSGQLGVPVTVVDDEVIVGFDRGKLESALTA
jgi:glutaredoxin-like YruB-family protein